MTTDRHSDSRRMYRKVYPETTRARLGSWMRWLVKGNVEDGQDVQVIHDAFRSWMTDS